MRNTNLVFCFCLSALTLVGCSSSDSSYVPYEENDPDVNDSSEENDPDINDSSSDFHCSEAKPMQLTNITEYAPASEDYARYPFVDTDGESVFATLFVDGKAGLYRLSWDGSQKTLLREEDEENTTVLGQDSLFIATRDGIVRVKKDGSKTDTLGTADDRYVDTLLTDDTYLYTASDLPVHDCTDDANDSIVAFNQVTGERRTIAEGLCGAEDLVSDGNYLYFMTKPTVDTSHEMQYSETKIVKRVPRTGGTVETIAEFENVADLFLSNGWLYTSIDSNPEQTSHHRKLVRIPTKGGKIEEDTNCMSSSGVLLATDTGVLTMRDNQLDFVDADDHEHHLTNSPEVRHVWYGHQAIYKNSLFVALYDKSIKRYDVELSQ
jgi:hypothetical protein